MNPASIEPREYGSPGVGLGMRASLNEIALLPLSTSRAGSTFFKPERLRRAELYFERRGGLAIVLSRVLPIGRTCTPVVAGAGRMRYPRLALFDTAGGLVWAMGVSLAGYFLGSAIPNIDRYLLPIVLAIIFASVAPTSIHLWRENRTDISLLLRKRLERWAPPQ